MSNLVWEIFLSSTARECEASKSAVETPARNMSTITIDRMVYNCERTSDACSP